ncbi:MAG: PAM68 family protein [Cyanobacteria bacterium J06639_18]
MSPEPERNKESSKNDSLPFEPKKKRQNPANSTKKGVPASKKTVQQSQKRNLTKEDTEIPKVVSQRMIRRVAIFCGVPTTLGISTLVASYVLLIYANVELPPLAVLLVNLGFFGLGVLGITYGVLSASWDEQKAGSLLGFSEFSTNIGRMVQGWRESRQNKA